MPSSSLDWKGWRAEIGVQTTAIDQRETKKREEGKEKRGKITKIEDDADKQWDRRGSKQIATMNYSKAPAPSKPFWDLTVPEISQWIHALTPGIPNTGGMLFPAPAKGGQQQRTPEEFAAKKALGELLVNNLMTALSSASSFSNNTNGGGNNDMSSPDAKRQKIEHSTNNGGGDKYKVLDPSFAQSNHKSNTSELSPGAILSRITLGGLVNGMSGVEGGCVDTLSCIPLSDLQKDDNSNQVDSTTDTSSATKGIDAVIETAGNLVLKDLIKLARGLLRSISAR